MSEIFSFLQVDDTFFHESFFEIKHASSDKGIPKPVITESMQAKLINIFKDDVASLKEFTGKDFSEWKYSY